MSRPGGENRVGPATPWSDFAPARPSALSGDGMVASAHPAASLAGARVLADGGNAADAALAMAAMTAVAMPAQCGVGGDAFAVMFDAASSVCTAVHGSGFGPDGADPAFFAERGRTTIPLVGACSVAVPGWASAIEAIHRRWATRPLEELFIPAVTKARSGMSLAAKAAVDLSEHETALRMDPATAAVLLPGGGRPHRGDRLCQPDLARTLEKLAEDPGSFYVGELGERLVSALQRAGAPFTGDEWAAQTALVGPAHEGAYAGHRLFTTGMPSPGYMVLQQAAMLDGSLEGLGLLSAPAISLMAQAAARSFADRFARVGSDSDAWQGLLAHDAVAAARRLLASGVPMRSPAVRSRGDTTSLVVVDRNGNAVSFIHSLGFTWGAKLTVEGTGVLLNNRLGRGAYLIDGHPNELKPRRRPMHTLNAWIAADDAGRLRAVGNTPGGDGQVQWNMQLLSHLLGHGLEAQAAVDAPRFSVAPGSDANSLEDELVLTCESRVGGAVLTELRSAGLPVLAVGAFEGGGGAQLIDVSLSQGSLAGASDSRQDGCALGV